MAGAEDIDLWIVRPELVSDSALLTRYRALLSPDETKRLGAFRFENNRHEYLVTRALARTTLSAYRPVAPEAWRFTFNAYGRPSIEPPCGLCFNLSNTSTLVVCAVSEHHELGVDTEPLDRADAVLEVAETVFSDAELGELHALAPPARRERAVSLWTLKEAYIKARGIGMSAPLRQITVRFEPSGALRLDLAPEVHDDASAWWLGTRDLHGHRVALAVRSGGAQARVTVVEKIPLA